MEKNFIFSELLFQAIEQSHKSVNCIERELGYPRNAIHNYKEGVTPSAYWLIELAHYFHVTPDYLLGLSDGVSPISIDIIFNQSDEEQKIKILSLALDWEKNKNHRKVKSVVFLLSWCFKINNLLEVIFKWPVLHLTA